MGVSISSVGEQPDGSTTVDGTVGLTSENLNTSGTTTDAAVGTGQTAITLTNVKGVDIAPTAGDGGTYYFGYETGAKTASNGKLLDADHPLIITADYGQLLNITIYISRSTGTGTILIDEFSIT